jgi:predicted SprT family Zn-dependent metalloprotease
MAYDLNKVQLEFKDICQKAGVPINIPIYLNGRLTRTLGRVHHKYNPSENRYTSTLVEFSKQLLETATDKSIHNVIMHEASHYITTYRTGEVHGHDAIFKSVCMEIGTDNNSTHTKVERTVEEKNLYKYQILCPTCKKFVGGFHRKCKTIDHINECFCKSCSNSGLKVLKNW